MSEERKPLEELADEQQYTKAPIGQKILAVVICFMTLICTVLILTLYFIPPKNTQSNIANSESNLNTTTVKALTNNNPAFNDYNEKEELYHEEMMARYAYFTAVDRLTFDLTEDGVGGDIAVSPYSPEFIYMNEVNGTTRTVSLVCVIGYANSGTVFSYYCDVIMPGDGADASVYYVDPETEYYTDWLGNNPNAEEFQPYIDFKDSININYGEIGAPYWHGSDPKMWLEKKEQEISSGIY